MPIFAPTINGSECVFKKGTHEFLFVKYKTQTLETPTIPDTNIDLSRFSAQGGGGMNGFLLNLAFDKDSSTYWQPKILEGNTNWLLMYNPKPLLISKVSFTCSAEVGGVSFQFFVSDNGEDWAVVEEEEVSSGAERKFLLKKTGFHKYYRVEFSNLPSTSFYVYAIEFESLEKLE